MYLVYSAMECLRSGHWYVFMFMLILGALKYKKGYLLRGTHDVTSLYQQADVASSSLLVYDVMSSDT